MIEELAEKEDVDFLKYMAFEGGETEPTTGESECPEEELYECMYMMDVPSDVNVSVGLNVSLSSSIVESIYIYIIVSCLSVSKTMFVSL